MPYSYIAHQNDFAEHIVSSSGPGWWVILHVESELLDNLWTEINLAIEKSTKEITQKHNDAIGKPKVQFSDWKIEGDLVQGNVQPLLRNQQTGMWSAYIELDWNHARQRKLRNSW